MESSVTTLYAAGFEFIPSNSTHIKIISGNGMMARIVNSDVRYYHAGQLL